MHKLIKFNDMLSFVYLLARGFSRSLVRPIQFRWIQARAEVWKMQFFL